MNEKIKEYLVVGLFGFIGLWIYTKLKGWLKIGY
jgi:hypothetical protein